VPLLLLLPAAPAGNPSLLDRIDTLAPASVTVDERRQQLIIDLPVVGVPAGETVRTPVYRVTIPFDVALNTFAVEVVDEAGQPVPRDRLHHVIISDPTRRGLMLPLVLPIFGASKESPSPRLPRYLFGLPLPAGRRYLVGAMLMNPDQAAGRLRVRVRLSFLRPGHLFPVFRVYPFTMDVTYPLGGEGGRHDFDLPPGHLHRQWEGSPAIPGSIIGLGAHAHDYATLLSLVDMTSGDTLWQQRPVLDSTGRVVRVPVTFFSRWYRLGLHLTPDHVYRVSVEYDNPTGATIPFGGMGSILGLMVPDRKTRWPVANLADPTFQTSLRFLLDNMADGMMAPHAHNGH
jgi:hypothetical protein